MFDEVALLEFGNGGDRVGKDRAFIDLLSLVSLLVGFEDNENIC